MFSFKLGLGKKEETAGGYLSVHFDEHGIAVAFRESLFEGSLTPSVQICEYLPCASEEEFPAKLSQFVARHHLQHVATNFILKPGSYRLIYLDAPKVPEDELATAARFLVKDLISYPLNEAVIDAFVVPGRPGQKEKMYVVATELKTIEIIVKTVEAARLKVNCIDIPELTLANVLTTLERQSESPAAASETPAVDAPTIEAPAVETPAAETPALAPTTGGLMDPTPTPTDAPTTGGLMDPAPIGAAIPGGLMQPSTTETTPEAATAPAGLTQPAEGLTQETPADTPVGTPPPAATPATDTNTETGMLLLQPNYAEISVSREHLLCLAREVETALSYMNDAGGNSEALEAEVLEKVSTEIERSVSYYQSHLSRGKMQDFWVLTMLHDQDALIASLQTMLSGDVKPLDLNEKINFNTKLERPMQARCLIALGGVLREQGGNI